MPRVTYDQVADEFIYGSWGCDLGDNVKSAKEFVKEASREHLNIILLVDIAKSLRVLRCQGFINIPETLWQIKIQTRKPRKRRVAKKGST